MKGFETQNIISDSLDNWTIQQCEDYLAKYPKGLKADQARARIKKLQPPVITKKEEPKPSSSDEEKIPHTNIFDGLQVNQATSHSNNYRSSDDTGIKILKVLATIICIGIMIFGIVAIFAVNPSFAAVLPAFYFPIKWIQKMWE